MLPNKPLVPTRNGEAPLLAAQRWRWTSRMHIQRPIICTASALYPAIVLAIMFESFPLKLANAEQIQLEQMACSNLHGVGAEQMNARAYKRRPTSDAFAEVSCRSHGVFNRKPMRFVVRCERTKMQWKCSDAQLEIIVPVATKEVRVRPGNLSAEQATGIVRKIGSSGLFQNQPLLDMLQSPCELRPGSSRELIDVGCTGWVITMSAWCPTSDCPRVVAAGRVFE
jgi:hypothetical protein